jgi:DNA-binding XRE family transcriptional regulator
LEKPLAVVFFTTLWYSVQIDVYRDIANTYVDTVQMTPEQLKMARAALGWGVRELGKKAGITANTISRIENGSDAKQSTIVALTRALEAGGVQFIDENGFGAGVRLKKPRGRKK